MHGGDGEITRLHLLRQPIHLTTCVAVDNRLVVVIVEVRGGMGEVSHRNESTNEQINEKNKTSSKIHKPG